MGKNAYFESHTPISSDYPSSQGGCYIRTDHVRQLIANFNGIRIINSQTGEVDIEQTNRSRMVYCNDRCPGYLKNHGLQRILTTGKSGLLELDYEYSSNPDNELSYNDTKIKHKVALEYIQKTIPQFEMSHLKTLIRQKILHGGHKFVCGNDVDELVKDMSTQKNYDIETLVSEG